MIFSGIVLKLRRLIDVSVSTDGSGDVSMVGPKQDELDRLLNLFQVEQYDAAEELALSLTNKFPAYQFCWKVLGVVLNETGRYAESLTVSRKSVMLAPKDHEAHNNLGNTLKALGRLDEATESFREVIKIKPDFAMGHFNLATILSGTNIDESVDSYKNAIAIRPDYTEAHNNLGNLLQDLGRLDESVVSYRTALEFSPDYAVSHFNLGNVYRRLKLLDQSEASYLQAITCQPNYSDAHYNLGSTLRDLGRIAEAEIAFRQAIKFKPDHANAFNNLGLTLLELGRLEEAETILRQAVAINDNFSEAHDNLGIALTELGRLEEAVFSFQAAFTLRTGIHPDEDDGLSPATNGLFFELTNKCNFHCDFCPSDSQKRELGSMDLQLIKRLYEETSEKKYASSVNLHLMGEPTLHPDLLEILRFAESRKVKTDLVTNGSTLIEKMVPPLLDTLYGTITASHMTPTEETYHFRGKVGLSWDRYIGNLRLLVREYLFRISQGGESKNEIVIRVMATQNTEANVTIVENEGQAREILKEWSDFVAGIEREFGLSPFLRKDFNDKDLLKENSQTSVSYPLQQGVKLVFWRAFTFANTRVNDDFKLKALGKTAYCSHPFTDVGVLWNGDVTLCCLDHDGQLSVGNIRDTSLESVITSGPAKELRASMLGDSPLPTVCRNCQAKPVRRGDPETVQVLSL